MHVAIVIVGFRSPDDVARCVRAIQDLTHRDFEVVVCENGGPAAFNAQLAALPSRLAHGQPVQVVQAPRNLGYAGGVNYGMAQAPGANAWWVLNPDTLPKPDALSLCLERLAVGDCEAVGCVVELPGGTVQSYGGRWQMAFGRAVSIGWNAPINRPVDAQAIERAQNYLNGAVMLVSRRFLEVVGPMREDYFLYCEEVEWFLRARRLGIRLGFTPFARVGHEGGVTTGSYAQFRDMPKTPVYLNARNRILVTRDLSPILTPIVALGALISLTLRFGRRRAWRQLGYALGGWWAGLLGRRGPPAWITV